MNVYFLHGSVSGTLYRFAHHTRGGGGGASKSLTKDKDFKLCPALVQEQVYIKLYTPGSLHQFLSCSWKPSGIYGGRRALETELVYTTHKNGN